MYDDELMCIVEFDIYVDLSDIGMAPFQLHSEIIFNKF